jgi:hypothetical protein
VLAYDFNLLSEVAAASSFLHTDEAEVGGTGLQGGCLNVLIKQKLLINKKI